MYTVLGTLYAQSAAIHAKIATTSLALSAAMISDNRDMILKLVGSLKLLLQELVAVEQTINLEVEILQALRKTPVAC